MPFNNGVGLRRLAPDETLSASWGIGYDDGTGAGTVVADSVWGSGVHARLVRATPPGVEHSRSSERTKAWRILRWRARATGKVLG